MIHQLDAAMNDEKRKKIFEKRKKDLMAIFEPPNGQPAKKRAKKDELRCSNVLQNMELDHHTSSSFSDESFVPSIQETKTESLRQSSTCSLGHSDAQQVSFGDNEITDTQQTCANQSKTLSTRQVSVIKFANSSNEQADQSNFENPDLEQSNPNLSQNTGVVQVSNIKTEILDAEQASLCKIVYVDLEESSIGSFESLRGEQDSQDDVLSPGNGQIGDDEFLILDTQHGSHVNFDMIVIISVGDERDNNLRIEQDNPISFESLAANQANPSIPQNSDTMPVGTNDDDNAGTKRIGDNNSEILDIKQKSLNNIERLNARSLDDDVSVDDFKFYHSSGDEDTIDNDSLHLHDCGENGYTEEHSGIEKTSNDYIGSLDILDTCNPPYSDRFRARNKGLVFLSFKAYVTATRARRREEVAARKAVRAQRALKKNC